MVPLIFKEHFGQNRIVLKKVVSVAHNKNACAFDGHMMSQSRSFFKRKDMRQPGTIAVSFNISAEHSHDTAIKNACPLFTSNLKIIKSRLCVVYDFGVTLNDLSV